MQTNENYTIDQSKKLNALTADYSNTSIRDFLNSHGAHTAAFVQTKLALAAESMVEKGFTPESIAKDLGFPSGPAVTMLIRNWGTSARKRGGTQ